MHSAITTLLFSLMLFCLPLSAQDPFAGSGAPLLDADPAAVEFLPVEEAYQLALEVLDEQHIRLYWQIADNYYLYRKRFAFTVQGAAGKLDLTPQMPAGISHEDEYFGLSEVYYHNADITLALAEPASQVTLTVTSQGCADAGLCYPPQRASFAIDLPQKLIAASQPKAAAASTTTGDNAAATAATPAAAGNLLFMLLLAFVGGTILNLMPCVFPVLSLKVFSFATGSEHTKHVHGWVYAAGVVSSFLLVAAILVGLQQAGSAIGWGFQLQSPRFVGLLAYLFFAMGLSLSGLIELGSGLMGTGSALAERGGYSGSFFTGVLATVVASPCTAPFMGTALGFAATQPPLIALTVFAALGAGLAAPMLLLSYSKTLRALMPKPGAWMETFKQLLAFPLYATAIWLLWVVGRQTSTNTMALLLCGMLALALGLWAWRHRNWGKLLAAGALLVAVAIIASPLLSQNTGGLISNSSAEESAASFSQQKLQALLDRGNPIFVNVTADWCITCIANEQTALSTEAVQLALQRNNITYLKADWTNYNAEIAAFLKQFKRNGIPLYLLYSGRRGEEPQILPQLLTTGTVLEAIERI